MEVGCRDCKSWEEQMYWIRFGTHHFCQFLTAGFDQQLAIPKKFVNNLREKMRGTVVLKGPTGNVWIVGLVTNENTLYFKRGWNKFVEDHYLEQNDILFFRYNGNSRFDVLVFDQELCERAACYFVRKCEHAEREMSGSKQERSSEESLEACLEENNEKSVENISRDSRPKKFRNRGARTPPSGNRSNSSFNNRAQRRARVQKGLRSAHSPLQLKSQRRKVTLKEIEKAQNLALKASSQNSFVVVMRASHAYKGSMSIPVEWAKIHLPKESQQVVLRVKDKTWKVKYLFKECYHGGLFSGGWGRFAMENFLEEFDACVFDLVRGSPDQGLIFDVKIFRVVQEVTPPSHVASRGKSCRVRHMQDSSEDDEDEDDGDDGDNDDDEDYI